MCGSKLSLNTLVATNQPETRENPLKEGVYSLVCCVFFTYLRFFTRDTKQFGLVPPTTTCSGLTNSDH